MKKLVPFVALLLFLTGCISLEMGSGMSQRHYSEREAAPKEIGGENHITTRQQLYRAIYNIVLSGMGQEEHNDTLTTKDYEGNPLADAKEITGELLKVNPLCAYTVSSITPLDNGSTLNITEIRVSVVYHIRRDPAAVVTVLDTSDLEERFTKMVENFEETNAFSMTGFQDNPERFMLRLEKCWANQTNGVPLGLDDIQYAFFPEEGKNAIVEINVSYLEEDYLLHQWKDAVEKEAARIAAEFTGTSDREKIDFVFYYLRNNVAVDQVAMQAVADYVQPKKAPYTSYGALVEHSAAQSGFALGARELCKALGLKTTVMIGTYQEKDYYWLYVYCDGWLMHFDPTPDIFDLSAPHLPEHQSGPDTSLGSFQETEEAEAMPEYLFTAALARIRFSWDTTLYNIY